MKVLLFGATGMVGQGVLRECLLAADVEQVLAIGRAPTGQTDSKLRNLVHADLFDYRAIEAELAGFDACFFCLGVSSVGMAEAPYTRLTYDLTLVAAEVLARLNPQMAFTYVSGAGTDSTEEGASMWRRVKGRTENAVRRLFTNAYMFRPGIIVPLNGVRSKTTAYRAAYAILRPLLPLLQIVMPGQLVTTEEVGLAMLAVARHDWPAAVLEIADIRAAARS